MKFDRMEDYYNFNTSPNEKNYNLNRKSRAGYLYHY
jgi:hypothetical protein